MRTQCASYLQRVLGRRLALLRWPVEVRAVMAMQTPPVALSCIGLGTRPRLLISRCRLRAVLARRPLSAPLALASSPRRVVQLLLRLHLPVPLLLPATASRPSTAVRAPLETETSPELRFYSLKVRQVNLISLRLDPGLLAQSSACEFPTIPVPRSDCILMSFPSCRSRLDNEINQKIVRKMLEKVGCAVAVANNGLEAVEIMDEKRGVFSLVLMVGSH